MSKSTPKNSIAQFERDIAAAWRFFRNQDELAGFCQPGRRKHLEREQKTLFAYFFPGGERTAKSKALHFNILVAAARVQQKSPRHLNSRELAESAEVRAVSLKKRVDTGGEFERKIIDGSEIPHTIHWFMAGVRSLEYRKYTP